MEAFTLVFVLIGVAAVTAVVFGIWVVFSIVRFIFRGLFSIFEGPQPPPIPFRNEVVCGRSGCQAVNAPGARFCRRCGQELADQEYGYSARQVRNCRTKHAAAW